MARHDPPPSPLRSLAISGSLDPPPVSLLDDPLEYFFVEHFRQRSLCVLLRDIAARGVVPVELAHRIAAILAVDMPLHHEDEECDLFPVLIRRGKPEDDLSNTIARLKDDRTRTDRVLRAVARAFLKPSEYAQLTIEPRDAVLTTSYAAELHRHLAIENGILLVIARKRLSADDILAMGQSMKRRRGLHF